MTAAVVALMLVVAVPAASAPGRLGVRGYDDFRLLLSKQRIDPGRTIVGFKNFGVDEHDLKLKRKQGGPEYSFEPVPSGETRELTLRFRRDSRYRLWCSLPGHEEGGMVASVRVRKHG
jgi:hypothetical protein